MLILESTTRPTTKTEAGGTCELVCFPVLYSVLTLYKHY
jgi:hypothetical protein